MVQPTQDGWRDSKHLPERWVAAWRCEGVRKMGALLVLPGLRLGIQFTPLGGGP